MDIMEEKVSNSPLQEVSSFPAFLSLAFALHLHLVLPVPCISPFAALPAVIKPHPKPHTQHHPACRPAP